MFKNNWDTDISLCKRTRWIYISESNFWWKVPGPDKCRTDLSHKCLSYYDSCVIIMQGPFCFRCKNIIKNDNFDYLSNKKGFNYKNNIYCHLCIDIVEFLGTNNLTTLLIKKQYTNI